MQIFFIMSGVSGALRSKFQTNSVARGLLSAPTGATCRNPFGTSPLGLSGEMKKWLSYREQPVLGRALMMAEIMAVTAMARRLAALVLLQAKLDAN